MSTSRLIKVSIYSMRPKSCCMPSQSNVDFLVYCNSISIPQFFRLSRLFLVLKQLNYSWFDILLSHCLYRFYLDGSYMSIRWKGPNQTLAQTKPWPAAYDGGEVKTHIGCTQTFVAAITLSWEMFCLLVFLLAKSMCTLSSC